MKQEALAVELADDWNQRKVSLLEAKEEIEPELLRKWQGPAGAGTSDQKLG